MNPYRLVTGLRRQPSDRARFRRIRELARLAAVPLFGSVFFTGWAVGRATPTIVLAQAPAAAESALPAPVPAPSEADAPEAHPEPAPAAAPPPRYTLSPAQARATIADKARHVLVAIAHKEPKALAAFVEPGGSVTLGSVDGSETLALSPLELARCLQEDTPRIVGDGVSATCAELWKDHLSHDYTRISAVDYNLPSPFGHPAVLASNEVTNDGVKDPTLEAHRDSIVVQYVVRNPEGDSGDADAAEGWSTLRLVFDPLGEQWRLTAVLWSEWSM